MDLVQKNHCTQTSNRQYCSYSLILNAFFLFQHSIHMFYRAKTDQTYSRSHCDELKYPSCRNIRGYCNTQIQQQTGTYHTGPCMLGMVPTTKFANQHKRQCNHYTFLYLSHAKSKSDCQQ